VTSAFDEVELFNFYRTPMQRYYRRWMPKLLLMFIFVASIAAAIKYTPIISELKKFNSNPTPAATKSPIPISTTIAPTGGETAKPVTIGQRESVSVSCSGAVSMTVTASSKAVNTLTIINPAKSQVRSTGSQPSIITYGATAGVWQLIDVAQGSGSAAVIRWSPNGARCVQR
jgi:cytoskeletal protein RodZ